MPLTQHQLAALAFVLALGGCGYAGCESLDMHSLDSPETPGIAGDCHVTIKLDTPLGHKLPGEK